MTAVCVIYTSSTPGGDFRAGDDSDNGANWVCTAGLDNAIVYNCLFEAHNNEFDWKSRSEGTIDSIAIKSYKRFFL